jgi:hypothetical protein
MHTATSTDTDILEEGGEMFFHEGIQYNPDDGKVIFSDEAREALGVIAKNLQDSLKEKEPNIEESSIQSTPLIASMGQEIADAMIQNNK